MLARIAPYGCGTSSGDPQPGYDRGSPAPSRPKLSNCRTVRKTSSGIAPFSDVAHRGKKCHDTVLIWNESDSVDTGMIQMDELTCQNLRVKSGDMVDVEPIQRGERVRILPFDDSNKDLSYDIRRECLESYFREGMFHF